MNPKGVGAAVPPTPRNGLCKAVEGDRSLGCAEEGGAWVRHGLDYRGCLGARDTRL